MKIWKALLVLVIFYGMVGCVEFHDRQEIQLWQIVCIEDDFPYNVYGLQYSSVNKLSLEEEIKLCEEN